MQAIYFETSSEEGGQAHGGSAGLDFVGGEELSRLHVGDLLWLITRLAAERNAPGLCGRLVVGRVDQYRSGPTASVEVGRTHVVVAQRERSVRRTPFGCEFVSGWNIWRQHYRGMRILTHEQGNTLQMHWDRQCREDGIENGM